MSVWRVGRKLGVTLHRDEVFVGHVCSATVAAEIVETMNRVGRLLDEVRGETARERSQRGMWACCGAPLADHPLDRCPEAEPGDAERRSEATPQNDLRRCGSTADSLLRDHEHVHRCSWLAGREHVHHCECGTDWTDITRTEHDRIADQLSRVDPYDTTKGLTP